MQSLSIKMVPVTRTGACGRVAAPITARARARGVEIPCGLSSVVAAAAASFSSPSPSSGGSDQDAKEEKAAVDYEGSFLSRSQTYALLKQQMVVAAKFEDYKEAARLTDSLRSFEEKELVLQLRSLMRKAVNEEKFGGRHQQWRKDSHSK